MINKRHFISCHFALLACALILNGCGNNPAHAEPRVVSEPYDWQNAMPEHVIFSAFTTAEYEPDAASDLAEAWVELNGLTPGGNDEDDAADSVQYDWENTNIFAAIADAFMFAGHEPQEAADLAQNAIDLLGIEVGGLDSPGGDPCLAYKVRVIYCTYNPLRKHSTQKIDRSSMLGNDHRMPHSAGMQW